MPANLHPSGAGGERDAAPVLILDPSADDFD
jgi:hypothetical protein